MKAGQVAPPAPSITCERRVVKPPILSCIGTPDHPSRRVDGGARTGASDGRSARSLSGRGVAAIDLDLPKLERSAGGTPFPKGGRQTEKAAGHRRTLAVP